MPPLELFQIIGAVMIVGGAAFVQGFSGFGFGILASAVLSTYWPSMERATVLASLCAIIV